MNANPTTIVSWDVFQDADSYDILVKSNTGAQVGLVLGHTQTSIALIDVIDPATAAGSNFKVEVRAVVNGFKTLWTVSDPFNWSPNYPGNVTGVTLT